MARMHLVFALEFTKLCWNDLLHHRSVVKCATPRDKLEVGELSLDRNSVEVSWQGEPVSLSLTERRLLEVMMERPNHACSRDFLITRVWGDNDEVDFRTVDVNIRRLRQALTESGAPDFVRTVRGVGYALRDS